MFEFIEKSTVLAEFHNDVDGVMGPEAVVEFDEIFTRIGVDFFGEFLHDVDLIQNDLFHFFFVFLHHFDVDDFDCDPYVINRVIAFKHLSKRSLTKAMLRVVFINFVGTLFEVHDFASLH